MSENLAKRLSRFTPDSAGLDRDALLFAAGRASARSRRPWQALAGLLAASQVLTLVLWWSRPPASSAPARVQDAASDVVSVPPAPIDSQRLGVWAQRDQVLATEGNLPPLPVKELVPSDPPLHAFPAPTGALCD